MVPYGVLSYFKLCAWARDLFLTLSHESSSYCWFKMLTQTNGDWQSACSLVLVTYPRNWSWLPKLASTRPSLNVNHDIKTSTYGVTQLGTSDPEPSTLKFQVPPWNFKFQLEISSSSLKVSAGDMITWKIYDIIWRKHHKFLTSYAITYDKYAIMRDNCHWYHKFFDIDYDFIGNFQYHVWYHIQYPMNLVQERLKRDWYHTASWYNIWYHTKTYGIIYDIIVLG